MQVIEHGKYSHTFKCEECECVFSANCNEFNIEQANDINAHTTEYVLRSVCPECDFMVRDVIRRSKDYFFGRNAEIRMSASPIFPYKHKISTDTKFGLEE